MADREPRRGNEVEYVLGNTSKNVGQVRSAKVVLVHEVAGDAPQLVNLNVFIATSEDIPNQAVAPGNANWLFKGVKYDAAKTPGTWHWAEKHVPEVAQVAKAPNAPK